MQVGCGEEEEEYICLAYKKKRWVRFSLGASAKEVKRRNSITLNCSILEERQIFLNRRCLSGVEM